MALTAEWFTHHRERMSRWHRDDLKQILEDLATMQAEIQQLQQQLAGHPASGTITATTKDGTVTDTYAPGTTIYLTAGSFLNAEGAPITGTVPGTWASDQGTITANPANADEAQLVNVPLGTAVVTFTTTGGLVLNYTAVVADQTPVSGVITGSTTAPTDEPAPTPVATA